jgi:hypothetical protein
MSYTELEHETAETLGLPRLVFLLGKDAEGPAEMFLDLDTAPGNTPSGPDSPTAKSPPPP